MNINYYAPGTSTEYRLWAVGQIDERFPSAELVAVHDHQPPEGRYIVTEGYSGHLLYDIHYFCNDLMRRYTSLPTNQYFTNNTGL